MHTCKFAAVVKVHEHLLNGIGGINIGGNMKGLAIGGLACVRGVAAGACPLPWADAALPTKQKFFLIFILIH